MAQKKLLTNGKRVSCKFYQPTADFVWKMQGDTYVDDAA